MFGMGTGVAPPVKPPEKIFDMLVHKNVGKNALTDQKIWPGLTVN